MEYKFDLMKIGDLCCLVGQTGSWALSCPNPNHKAFWIQAWRALDPVLRVMKRRTITEEVIRLYRRERDSEICTKKDNRDQKVTAEIMNRETEESFPSETAALLFLSLSLSFAL